MMAKAIIRVAYRVCACTIRGLYRLCAAFAASMPSDLGPSLSLDQMSQGRPEVDSTPELVTECNEEHREERLEDSVVEDMEGGIGEGSESDGVILEEEVRLEGSRRESEDERDTLDRDTRLEFWEWSHDWEDLDWVEEVWLVDELVTSDLNEASLPDELWE